MRFATDDILQPFNTTWLPPGVEAAMLRLDRVHPLVSGNKWFKLKYNLEAAAGRPVVTFGGAWSNHILATAAACREQGIRCTGVIRGEQPPQLSHTLGQAQALGMELLFVSREQYRRMTDNVPIGWNGAYIIPEGGHNEAGVRGCREILQLADVSRYTHILCAVGTGTTLAGLIQGAVAGQAVWGISVLKGAGTLEMEVREMLEGTEEAAWQLLQGFHEGGYAKTSPRLLAHINDFYRETGIPTDIVYTGKLTLAARLLAENGAFPPGSRLLLVHTGGLQGNESLAKGVLCF
ncbi:1-aminocyclopropane-1-carboxylate deaminase/D-cysteine desulfhydrase [Chitinophaga lutea]